MVDTVGIESRAENVGGQILKGLLISPGEVWFPYSVEAIKLLREGLILAVRNTASVHLNKVSSQFDEDQHFSLMRIDSIEARHFIIDQIRHDRSDAAISVEGLLNKHQKEWRRSLIDPEENNLRIVASVSETGQELHLPMAAAALRGYEEKICPATGTVMLGEVAYLVVQPIVQAIVNREMDAPGANNKVIVAGSHTLYRSPSLDVLVDADALFRRHLGIFGFTGAGKSNLLSTLLSRALNSGNREEDEGEVNVVLFDVNNEFFGLLLDSLVAFDSHIIFVDDEIGASMSAFLDGDYSFLDAAAAEFLRTSTFSSAVNRLFRTREGYERLMLLTKALLAAGRFKRLEHSTEPMALGFVLGQIAEFADQLKSTIRGNGQIKKREAWTTLVAEMGAAMGDLTRTVTEEDFGLLRGLLALAHEYCASTGDVTDNPIAEVLKAILPKSGKDNHSAELISPIEKLMSHVAEIQQSFSAPLKVKGHSIDISGLFGALHDNKRTLVILLGAENSLRFFAEDLGTYVYDIRRKTGTVDPATVFIFDEADIFIPGQSASSSDEEKDAIKASKKIATTLSRRGRKYGLGLGIATQRIAYLDTSILAQLGTYFVGRLPRLSDRQKITEGFGIDRDSLQSGIRGVGDWVVLSHTAVGDRGAPLPVHFDNADERIIAFLKDFDLKKHIELESLMRHFDYLDDLVNNEADLTKPVSDMDFLP